MGFLFSEMHVFQKNAHKTQESLISGMNDVHVLVKR